YTLPWPRARRCQLTPFSWYASVWLTQFVNRDTYRCYVCPEVCPEPPLDKERPPMAVHPASSNPSTGSTLASPRTVGTEDFAALVAQFRRAHGLSQGQLARAARLSRTYIYHLETGQRQAPSVRVARAIARALELHGPDRQRLARAYANLTGKQMEDEA